MMDKEPPILSREQVRRVDQLAVSELAIPSLILMENAGKNAADWIRDRYTQGLRTVQVFCGAGNNGGDGLVIARHLHNHGIDVQAFIVGDTSRLSGDAAANYTIAQRLGLPITIIGDATAGAAACAGLGPDDLVVDALLGTGFAGEVREPLAGIIRGINAATVRAVIAIDVPSGLDCDRGAVGGVAICADTTITFVATKRGFAEPAARPYVGAIVVKDIGTPPALTRRVSEQV